MDISNITTAFGEFGGQFLVNNMTSWDLNQDCFVHTNVTKPQNLAKVVTQGEPRPYRANDDSSGNDPLFSDRQLIVRASKWDVPLDYEELRNTYLSLSTTGNLDPNTVPFHQYIVDMYSQKYLDHLYTSVVGAGDYNGSGSAVEDIATGFLTIIADEITATNLTAITTGALSSSNAVTKVEDMCSALPVWMKQKGFRVFASYDTIEKYKKHYRTLNGFTYNPQPDGKYKIDGFMATLEPKGWMGTSGRIIIVPAKNGKYGNDVLHMGINSNEVKLYPKQEFNVLKIRFMVPIGFQISDLEAIFVNDQA